MSGNGQVQIAYLHPHVVSHSFHESMIRTLVWDGMKPNPVLSPEGPYMISCPSGALTESRNQGMTQWLDDGDAEWLLWVDSDMGWEPDAVDMLLAAADPTERPVVGGLCFSAREMANDGLGGRRIMPAPVMYIPARDENGNVGFTTRWHWPRDSVVQVAGTGAAFLLIHRSVAEMIRAGLGDTWFDRVRQGDGRWVSEDLSFCWRLSKLEVPLFVHTGVKISHHKMVWLSEDDYIPPPDAPSPEAYEPKG